MQTVTMPVISGKTAFRLVNSDYNGRENVMYYLKKWYMPFNLEEFVLEAIKNKYNFISLFNILKTGVPELDSDLTLFLGKQFGFY